MKTQDILLIGGGLLAVYLITKPKATTTIAPYGYNPLTGLPNTVPQTALTTTTQNNQTAQIVSAASGALQAVADALSNFF